MFGLLEKGLDFFVGLTGSEEKGFSVMQMVVGEMDRRRDIDYGRKQVEVNNYEELARRMADGHAVRQRARRRIRERGIPDDFDDGYRRSD